jgi:hypothetical protein
LPKDAFTKDHVDKHAQFDEVGESILPRNFEKVCKTLEKFQKMQAEGTATFVLSPGTRPCVYGFNEFYIHNPEKWKEDLEDLSNEYKAKGGRLATKDILGPVYEIGFRAMGLGASTRHTPGPPEIEGEGKKTRALLHDHFTFSEDSYANNKYRLYNDNKAKAGAPPPATDAAGAAPLSLKPPKAKKSPTKKATAVKKTAPAAKAPAAAPAAASPAEKKTAPKKAAKKSTPAAARVPPDATDAASAAPLPTVEQRQKRPRLSTKPDPPPPSTLSAEWSADQPALTALDVKKEFDADLVALEFAYARALVDEDLRARAGAVQEQATEFEQAVAAFGAALLVPWGRALGDE